MSCAGLSQGVTVDDVTVVTAHAAINRRPICNLERTVIALCIILRVIARIAAIFHDYPPLSLCE